MLKPELLIPRPNVCSPCIPIPWWRPLELMLAPQPTPAWRANPVAQGCAPAWVAATLDQICTLLPLHCCPCLRAGFLTPTLRLPRSASSPTARDAAHSKGVLSERPAGSPSPFLLDCSSQSHR